jgi:hypothetical protein
VSAAQSHRRGRQETHVVWQRTRDAHPCSLFLAAEEGAQSLIPLTFTELPELRNASRQKGNMPQAARTDMLICDLGDRIATVKQNRRASDYPQDDQRDRQTQPATFSNSSTSLFLLLTAYSRTDIARSQHNVGERKMYLPHEASPSL